MHIHSKILETGGKKLQVELYYEQKTGLSPVHETFFRFLCRLLDSNPTPSFANAYFIHDKASPKISVIDTLIWGWERVYAPLFSGIYSHNEKNSRMRDYVFLVEL